MYNYPGNIHIHSQYSDGSGKIDAIAAAASSAGLSYIIITDHDTLQGLAEESIRYGVVVLVGVEISKRQGHYLALNLKELNDSHEDSLQQIIDSVNKEEGFGFIAHPFERGSPYLEKGKAYPWKSWPVFGFSGLELWNYTSHWRGSRSSLLKTLYRLFFSTKAAMDAPPPEALKLWDCYTAAGYKVTAIGGSDAHGITLALGFFKIPIFSYPFIFSTINTYIVLDEKMNQDFSVAKNQITRALKKGHCYISFDSLYPGDNFYYFIDTGNNQLYQGAELKYQPGLTLHVQAPINNSLLRLINNGRVIKEIKGKKLEYIPDSPGAYRAEVYFKPLLGRYRPWIYSNPLYLNDGQSYKN